MQKQSHMQSKGASAYKDVLLGTKDGVFTDPFGPFFLGFPEPNYPVSNVKSPCLRFGIFNLISDIIICWVTLSLNRRQP